MSSNIGWLFYKNYFKDIDYLNLQNDNNTNIVKKKTDVILHQNPQISQDEALGNTHFKATTAYPGLLLGSGYLHELPDIEGQAILGFDFDYTTGLPIIRGSSIKGVLRSAFRHPEYIKELISKEINVEELEKEIFDNNDVFFDAVIEKYGTNLLSDDYLAPHGEPTKNPIPLRFIKVSPNVTFRFDFLLTDGLLTKEDKLELFKSILADFGIGAKTNVGYGKFTDFSNYQTKEEREEAKKEQEKSLYKDAIESKDLEKLEDFKRRYPNSIHIDAVNKTIDEVKEQNSKEEIKNKFNSLDKNNKAHVKSFINKYQNDPLAQEYIEQLQITQPSKKTEATKTLDDLKTANKDKDVKTILMQVNITENDYKFIEEQIIRICENLNKKAKNKFFRKIDLAKFISNDFENRVKSKLGL